MGDLDHQRGSDEFAALGGRLKLDWQGRVARALVESGSRPRRLEDTARTPFEELAAAAVEAVWPDVERLMRPVFDMASRLESARSDEPRRTPTPSPATDLDERVQRSNPWMDADEAASVLNLTPHTLRRLAREERCPVVVRRIGGRWRFARSDVARFVAGEPPTLE